MAKKVAKKVDMKKVSKLEVSAKVRELFEGLGIVVSEGSEFGFTEGTLVLSMLNCDVQVKMITPKAGLERYASLEEEEEEEVDEETVEEINKELEELAKEV